MNSENQHGPDTGGQRQPPRNNGKTGGYSCLVIAVVTIFGGIVVLGILAAIAIPAFLKYIQRSKATESVAIIATLQHSALQYYQDSGGVDGACHFPPSANPVPAGEPCCEQVGPTGGEKWTPSPKTWEQEGWKALSFSRTEGTYFAYQMINKKAQEGTDLLELRAFADFKPGGPIHTYSIILEGNQNDQGECVANAQAAVVTNDLE